MRTPTALLRIGAALGSPNAKQTLNDRRATKTAFITNISNINKDWKAERQRMGFQNPLSVHLPRTSPDVGPRVRTGRVLPQSEGLAQTRAGLCIPTLVTNSRNPGVAKPTIAAPLESQLPVNRSWLHHGAGSAPRSEPLPAPAAPRSLSSAVPSNRLHGPFDVECKLNRQAAALINAELDPDTMFGDRDPDVALVPQLTYTISGPQAGPMIPAVDYESDGDSVGSGYESDASSVSSSSSSIASVSDDDPDSEWEDLTPEELVAADQRFVAEGEQIAAFEAQFARSQEPPRSAAVPDAPPMPVSVEARQMGQSTDLNLADLHAEIRAAAAERQGKAVVVASRNESYTSSPAQAVLLKSLDSLEKIYSFEHSSDEGDSGNASDMEHDWS